MSISSISPNRQMHNENHESSKSIEKRFISNPQQISEPLLSPNKRQFLKQMSPNITKKYKTFSNELISKPPNLKESKFQRPQLPASLKPSLDKRSKTTLESPTTTSSSTTNSSNNNNNSLPFNLRRSNSLINRSTNTESSIPDRFIPSRHNSTTGKLDSSVPQPAPNASPETHIKAQTSIIYQHHVAEACGLEMNSRILLYQPAPPESKKSINLISSQFKNQNQQSKLKLNNGKNSLPPSIASARAKKIPSAPERVLDAPGIVDDFYLNLLAWSSYNLLAIGLEDTVYVWNASTGSVGLLCELPEKKIVTSLKWSQDGSYVSIGKDDGLIEIWDIEKNIKLRTLNCDNHLTRIASQAWNQHILTSGSRMGNLYHSDVRISSHFINKFENCHSSEICGIEYNQKQFVTGGNDNVINIFDIRNNSQPLFSKNNHKAAVKALSWCPYQSNLLATGGGSTDKTINFWNTTTGSRVNTIETGSQISSLNWGYANGTGMEIVATHGYPTNNISLFSYPTLQKTGEITNAHDTRILNGCLSPDNLTLATVAGDENLKFWSLFDLKNSKKRYNDEDDIDDLNNKDSNEPKRVKRLINLR
ncbi:slp1 [Candida pseudojiufengensis]|uniref:slp1 n=1 Tax=Candida pseudojiufengensis TaxID=497109 RepID=UPI002225636E|nr:slp1 [Candida pseudojiufengensis]KAI5962924.1 slp1 [Candida pseudojiufengensis]